MEGENERAVRGGWLSKCEKEERIKLYLRSAKNESTTKNLCKIAQFNGGAIVITPLCDCKRKFGIFIATSYSANIGFQLEYLGISVNFTLSF